MATTTVKSTAPPSARKRSPRALAVTEKGTAVTVPSIANDRTLQHTPRHINCPACSASSLRKSEVELADLLFPEAFEKRLLARTVSGEDIHQVRYLSPESIRTYRECAWALGVFFGGLRLREIHDGHLRTYQSDRALCAGNWKRRCGQNRIGKEISLLLRILRAAGVWTDALDASYDQLPVALTDVQRVLEPAEQKRLLAALRARPERRWLYNYTVLALQTCASTKELRSIRLRDINYANRWLRIGVEGSKNKFRNRTIPLSSDEALMAMEELQERAVKFGARAPSHCVFPFGSMSRNGVLDVSRPITKCALKHPWHEARMAAGVPWVRPYDLRHTAITRMAEAGTPIAIIMSFAGHISLKMQQHYTTISMEAKRQASARVWAVAKSAKQPVAAAVEIGAGALPFRHIA